MKGGFTETVDKGNGGHTKVTILNKVKGRNGFVLLFIVSILIWLIVITSVMQTRSTPEKVNCQWNGWSSASTCSKTCGGGKQTQTRTIIRHEENGGASCVGENMREIDCNIEDCPTVHCTWSEWSMASTCSTTCGGGKQSQTRAIVKHEENGGALCTGENIKEFDCNTEDCLAVDCDWSDWSNATRCSKTCGGGKQFQIRTIVTQAENGGAVCNGTNTQEIDCNTDKCPADPCSGFQCPAGLTRTSLLYACFCLCGTSQCDSTNSNTCNNGVCKCGTKDRCSSQTSQPVCLSASGKTPKWGDSTASCQCSSDFDCTDEEDANRCEDGQCVCGSTGGKCTAASGEPLCTKAKDFTKPAKASDKTFAVCSCRANSCLPSAMAEGVASVCDTSDGMCKCGAAKNMACTNDVTLTKCMVTDTGVAPTAETDTANCQCVTSSTCAADREKPFCGNAVSAADPLGAEPAIGVCGKCKMHHNGDGGTSSCDSITLPLGEDDCKDIDNTCDGHKVCCKNGSCQTDASDC